MTAPATVTPRLDLLRDMSVGELAAGLRVGRWSTVEVISTHLERIAQTNPALNALATQWPEQALAEAERADARMRTGAPLPPLHGVPFTVKANIDMAGVATSNGSKALTDAVVDTDAPSVAQLRAAGAIPIAQTNMPDFAFRWHTASSAFGTTRNPWSDELTPGGSSGGGAAATAMGMAPIGLGTDTGGSLRHPAQCCGVAALRPTAGRIAVASAGPIPTPAVQAFTVHGMIARYVSDLKLLLPQLVNPDPRDPTWSPAPISAQPAAPCAFATISATNTAKPIDEAIGRAIRALTDAGYRQTDTSAPAITPAAELWHTLISADLRQQRSALEPLMSGDGQAFLDAFLSLADPLDADGILTAYRERHAATVEWSNYQYSVPLIVTPVSTQPPFPAGDDTTSVSVARIVESLRSVVAVNLLGLPACVVGTGVIDGLPQSVQIIAPRYREDLCLNAAAVIEQRYRPAPVPETTQWPSPSTHQQAT